MNFRTITYIVIAFSLLVSSCAEAQKAIFLHHSTGGNVFNQGNVDEWIANYNKEFGKNYDIEEFAYPNEPWPWANYAYDYWKLWIDGSCDNNNKNIACLDYFTQRYEMVIFKHCFPGATIGPDEENPSVSSKYQSLANYKLHYRELRDLMDSYPNTKFLIWTLAPLHRLATKAENANRAAQFVEWVKYEWLKEDGKQHPNIFIFDFFGVVAEQNQSPASGMQFALKYDYEKAHDDGDSHPNEQANLVAGPMFAKAVVNAFEGIQTGVDSIEASNPYVVYPSTINKGESINIENYSGLLTKIEIFNLSGISIYKNQSSSTSIQIPSFDLSSGMYLLKLANELSRQSVKIHVR